MNETANENTSETLLEVKGLTIHAGATALVQDLEFAMQAGERIGLIGESGSGKSLTATALLGLLPDELARERAGAAARRRCTTCSARRTRSCGPCAGTRSPWCSRSRSPR